MSAAGPAQPGLHLAVSAAHDLVAAAVLKLLFERDFAVESIRVLSDRPAEEAAAAYWGDESLVLEDAASADLRGVDLLFLCPPDANAAALLERAVESGVRVIDLVGVQRDQADPLLLTPDLVPLAGSQSTRTADLEARVFRCPDPLALVLATVLEPLLHAVGVEALRVQWLLPASTLGEPGIRELAGQAENLFNQRDLPNALYGRQITFNLLAGAPAPEDRLAACAHDLTALLGDFDLPVDQRAVWVPVFFGVSATLWLETRDAVKEPDLRALLRAAPGLLLAEAGDQAHPFPSPVEHALDSDAIHLGVLGEDQAGRRGWVLWLVADDVRRGRALNAVRIAESLPREESSGLTR